MGKIFGRCVGKMEFGARSLGTDLFLQTKKHRKQKKINSMIKRRDFLDAFCPNRSRYIFKKYLVNINKSKSYHMSLLQNDQLRF